MDIAEYVGKQISKLRDERGISQEKLAREINVAANTISRWENATHKPKLAELDRLANYFNVHISHFLPPDTANATMKNAFLARSAKGLDDKDLQQVERFISFIKAEKQLKKS